MSTSKLFEPIKVGTQLLQHRVVLAPLTRLRADNKHVPINPLMKTYYSQRGSTSGTLLISEATFISPRAGGIDKVPGIWNDEQIATWKEITEAVHANGSSIFMQLWALGRAARPDNIRGEGHDFVAPSPISIAGGDAEVPRELSISEIKEYAQLYAQAAKNAIDGAGFDGVEIHGANGYLVDQFLQDVSNKRSDEYGGSIENRSRFGLEVVGAIVAAVGEERTSIRISPWSTFQSMKMQNPIPQYTHFVSAIAAAHPNLAYVHVVEPEPEGVGESNDFIRNIWAPRPLITCARYTRETAIERADSKGDLIAFGQLFIANPDLPTRLENDLPLTPWDSKTFYTPGPKGYIDYAFAPTSRLSEVQAEAHL